MRYLYNLLFYLLLPFILLRLLWRSHSFPGYRQRLRERFGFSKIPSVTNSIWIHAVSFGEARIATTLITALQEKYPQIPIIVTTMTATGSEHITNTLGNKVLHSYIPYDYPAAVKRFLRHIKPQVLIIIETELWPNVLHYCEKANIPIIIANARLAERSAKGYQRLTLLFRPLVQKIKLVLAQTAADAERYIKLGVPKENVHMTGNIKFDVIPPEDLLRQGKLLREQLGKDRCVWIAASTHNNEEEIILAALQKIREKIPNALLILVPRHPQRFAEVAKLCEEQNYKVARRSKPQQKESLANVDVYLGDTMGELWLLYAAADIAFVGGSLIPQGGHNLLEPAALALPVISGSYLFNFQQIANYFQEKKALAIVHDNDELAATILKLFANPDLRKQQGEQGQQVVKEHQGALQNHLHWLVQYITTNSLNPRI